MKIDKKIRAMPWPGPYHGGQQGFAVTLAWPVVDGERMLVADFDRNVDKGKKWIKYGPDFRLVCSKKRKQAAVLYRGERTAKRHSLSRALSGFGYGGDSGPLCAFPEISGKDERALLRWLGIREGANHGLPELAAWTAEAVEAEELAIKDARGELRDEDVYLCPEELPLGLEEFIRRSVLPADKVLIYKKGNVRGTCFQCRWQVRATHGQRFRNFERTTCPTCGAGVVAILEGGAGFKADYVQNVVSLQRGTDGVTVFLRQWHLLRDYTAQWADIPGQIQEVARYAVRGDRAAKWQRETKENWYMHTCRYKLDDWTRMRNTSEVYDGSYQFHLPPDWREQVGGTCLRYVDLAGFMAVEGNKNPIRFLLDWVRYPAVEKLWKAGYTEVVREHTIWAKKEHQKAVNWKKASIRETIHFPMRLLKAWPAEEWTLGRLLLGRRVWGLVEEGRLREGEAEQLLVAEADLEQIQGALGHAPLGRVLRYIQGRSAQTYRDYLRDCETLGLDLDDRAVLFPPNLDAAHQRTISQVEYKKNKAKWDAFAKRLGGLQKLAWAADGFLIRPPADAGELIAEGKALSHCVGGYIDGMAKGETVILFIRRAEEPDKPYYTLEWRDGRVVQCRTTHNKSYEMDAPVVSFVGQWVARVTKKSRRRKGAVA